MTQLVDRRKAPSKGYRAVHVIPRIGEKRIEIQVRTKLQHLWAEISERLADLMGADLKYGRGPAEALETLESNSKLVEAFEDLERRISDLKPPPKPDSEVGRQIAQLGQNLNDTLAKWIRTIEALGSSRT